MVYTRALLKLSGESLQGSQQGGIDFQVVGRLADELVECVREGASLGVVVGGGNIFRGVEGAQTGLDRPTGDYMGMLATVINALAFQAAVEQRGVPTRVMSAIEMPPVAERYIRRRAVRHLEKGRLVIFAAGTGNPFFTTDTAAALRASEIGAQILLKATRVDGVYDSDPEQNPDARRFDQIGYTEALARNLRVMDATAISLCRENRLPVMVFDLSRPGNILRVLRGEPIGTMVKGE
ncbi:MAG TPA: UMP kinase [Candidatus Hydrogenedentes bacterium]|nr:UMP kinase [Candidatus Hydrogenedentota bacterium]